MNNSERMRIKLMSAWDKSIVFSPHGIRSFGSEMTEVDAPTPELPWEMEGIKGVVESLSNIHIATRTHETAYIAQLAASLITPPILTRRRVPIESYQQ